MRRRLGILVLSGLVAFSLGLGGPIGLRPAAAQESAQTIYVVQPGDTLSSIALRYGLTTAELAEANGLINPNLIYVGLKLIIPASARAAPAATPAGKPASVVNRLHIVQANETLFGIALKYGTTVRSLIETNRLDRAGFIVPGQPLIIPADARSNQAGVAQPTTPLPAPFTTHRNWAAAVVSGQRDGSDRAHFTAGVAHRAIRRCGLFPLRWMVIITLGLVGVGANPVSGIMPGLHTVVITATQENASPAVVTSNVADSSRAISTRNTFASQPIGSSCSIRSWSPPNARNSMPRGACSIRTRYWNGLFRVPVDQFIRISSPFGTRRSYDGGPFTDYHEGTDFAIPAGTPVYASGRWRGHGCRAAGGARQCHRDRSRLGRIQRLLASIRVQGRRRDKR